jgi:hypothetical protein
MKLPALFDFPQKDTRYPFLFLLLAALAAAGLAVYFYLAGDDLAMPWEKVADLQQVHFPAGRFEVLLQSLEIRVKGFLVTERYEVGLPVINTLAAGVLLGLVGVSAAYYLAVASTLRQLPFFVAIGLWMLFLATFNFDLLGIFPGTRQYILMAALLATGGTAFAFQAFLPHISMRLRLLVFAGLLLVLGLLVSRASPLSPALTALQLVNYGSLGCMAAAALFILWVSYENIHGLLWFNTQAENPQRRFSRTQFILISSLYLANLVLLYFKNTKIFAIDLLLLNEFLLLACSALVGFWGTRQREALYGRVLLFAPGAAFLYLAFGIITAGSIAYAFATANDPMIRAFSDLIVFSHLTFGFAFLLYLLINFGALLGQRLRVYRVVYNPKRFPFLTVVLTGTLLFASLLLQANLMLPYKAMAGYYNYLGDFYKKSGNDLLAEKFYGEGQVYNNNNIKSVYALASLYHEKLYYQTEINTLKKGTESYPTDKIFVRLANKYPERQQLFDQLFLLQQGVKQFPKSAPLLNNLALVYGTTAMRDSAVYYFDRAQQYSDQPGVVNSNRLAFYLLSGQGRQAAEMGRNLADQTYPPLQSNLLLLQSFYQQDSLLQNPVALPQAGPLKPADFALVYQGGMQGQTLSDQTTLKKLNQYLQADGNEPYRFDLTLEKAFVQQRLGQALEARTTLENLVVTEEDYAGYLLDLIGLQLLRQQHYQAAGVHFEQARAKGWPDAPGHLLMALALQPNQRVEAMLGAEQVAAGDKPELAAFARSLSFLLRARPVQVITQASDSLKVQYLQLNQGPYLLTDQEFLAITSTVNQPDLRLLAEKELATFYAGRQSFAEASQVIQVMLPRLTRQNQTLSDVNLLQADILLATGDLDGLQQALDRMYLTVVDKPKKWYYLAQLAQRRKQTKAAKKYYDLALQAMPAHEATVLAAAAFYATTLKQDKQSYDLLLNSITYDPFNPQVYKAYILQSLASGYSAFAESALAALGQLLPPAEMAAFRQQYQQQKAKRAAALETGQ